MKIKFFIFLVICFFIPFNLYAEGTVSGENTLTFYGDKGEFAKLTFTCVGDASNGSIPATQIGNTAYTVLKNLGFVLSDVDINPGTPTPAVGSFVYVNRIEGDNTSDILEGNGVLDDVDFNSVPPVINGVPDKKGMLYQWYLEVSQSTASAEWTVVFIFEKKWRN